MLQNIFSGENAGLSPIATPHILCVGGEDHHLRIPTLLALRDLGLKISAASPSTSPEFLRENIDHYNFPFYRFVGPVADIRALRCLSKIIKTTQPDIVQSFDTKPALFVPFAAKMAGSAHSIRTITGRAWLYSSNSATARALRPLHKIASRIAALCTSATVFEIQDDYNYFVARKMAGKRSVVIPAGGGGIDVDGFERALASDSAGPSVRDELDAAASDLIVTVGRVTREKGIPTLLRAADLVHQVRPTAKFLIVGPQVSEGPLAVPAADIARRAPYVCALGPRTDVPAILRQADVFAFPTEYREGIPRALLEAVVAGVPVVVTDMPGCLEVIEDGRTGYVVPPQAPELLANRILKILDDRGKAARMSARASVAVRQEYDIKIIAQRTLSLYNDILTSRTFSERAARPNALGGALR